MIDVTETQRIVWGLEERPRPWRWEWNDLEDDEGTPFAAVYDADGQRVSGWLTESEAALIVAAVNAYEPNSDMLRRTDR